MRQLSPKEVEVTLHDGQVLHFIAAEGDQIILNDVETYKKEIPPIPVHYYILQITPVVKVPKDEV